MQRSIPNATILPLTIQLKLLEHLCPTSQSFSSWLSALQPPYPSAYYYKPSSQRFSSSFCSSSSLLSLNPLPPALPSWQPSFLHQPWPLPLDQPPFLLMQHRSTQPQVRAVFALQLKSPRCLTRLPHLRSHQMSPHHHQLVRIHHLRNQRHPCLSCSIH